MQGLAMKNEVILSEEIKRDLNIVFHNIDPDCTMFAQIRLEEEGIYEIERVGEYLEFTCKYVFTNKE